MLRVELKLKLKYINPSKSGQNKLFSDQKLDISDYLQEENEDVNIFKLPLNRFNKKYIDF